MCQLTPSKICQLTPTVPDFEKPVIDKDSVNVSKHTVRFAKGNANLPRGPNNLGLPYYLSGKESDI